jgi:hypothetical protein
MIFLGIFFRAICLEHTINPMNKVPNHFDFALGFDG